MASITVLISGANRGLGKGFVEAYLAKPNHIVIAANRDPGHESSKALTQIPRAEGSRLVVVKVDGAAETDALEAVKTLAVEGIDHLDVVIANAGVAYIWPSVAALKVEDMLAHLKPNVFGLVRLYQATRELLLKAANPKWITIGSSAGCIQNPLPGPSAAYGPTKAAAHWLTKRINAEDENIIAFSFHPGFVQTDMGNLAASLLGMEQAPVSIKDSIDGMVSIVEAATKGDHGGNLFEYTGEKLAY